MCNTVRWFKLFTKMLRREEGVLVTSQTSCVFPAINVPRTQTLTDLTKLSSHCFNLSNACTHTQIVQSRDIMYTVITR